MTADNSQVTPPALAKPNWLLRAVLIVSLMFNLLVVGILIGHFHNVGQMGRGGPAYAQFVPGRFFAELGKERRRELIETLRNNREDLPKLHAKSADSAQKVAAELAQENYDPAKVNALVDGFTTGPESLAGNGSKVLKDFYAVLTPDERKALAKAIQDSQKRGNGAPHGGWFSRWWR